METNQIIRELENLSEEIELAKTGKAQAEGRFQSAIEGLKQTYGISEAELDQEIDRTQKRRTRVDEELQQRYGKLREEYEW